MNIYLTALAVLSLVGVGCTTQQTLYSNNGMTLIQVSSDPGLISRSFTVLVKEENGVSTIVTATKNRTLVETLAMPGALIGGAVLSNEGDTNVTNDSSSVSKSRSRSNPTSTNVNINQNH